MDASTEFQPNKVLFAAIAKAERLTLYEGLPHQHNEWKLFTTEKRDKPTVEFHGFLFYRPPLNVSAGDAEQLQGVLGDEGSFKQRRGEKKCGGFHPDYLAEWRAGEETYQVLLCFGCGEAKVFGPDRTLLCDIESGAKEKLKQLLKEYRKNRPPKQED